MNKYTKKGMLIITDEAIDKALEEQTDETGAARPYIYFRDMLRLKQGCLATLVEATIASLEKNRGAEAEPLIIGYFTGAYTTHQIFESQAQLNKEKLPDIIQKDIIVGGADTLMSLIHGLRSSEIYEEEMRRIGGIMMPLSDMFMKWLLKYLMKIPVEVL